jgi:hypothetical protein
MTLARTSDRRGVTLPEILIAGGLLLLVLGVAAELTRMAYKTFADTTKSTEIYRKQTLATDLLNRELRLCTEILSPGKNFTRVYRPGAGDPPLVFRRYSPSLNEETVVSYRFDPTEKTLIRESFEKQYDPRRRRTQVLSKERSPKVVADHVEEFVFQTVSPDEHYGAFFVEFELQVEAGEASSRIGSAVRVRSI